VARIFPHRVAQALSLGAKGVIPALQQENVMAGVCQLERQRDSGGAGADDRHFGLERRSGG